MRSGIAPRPFTLLLLILGIVSFIYIYYYPLGGIAVGEKAPAFSLPSRAGAVTLDQYRGKIILLNFWATWCPSCLEVMPSLVSLRESLDGRGFEVLAVSIDEEGWNAVDRFLERIKVNFPILLDARGDIADLYGTYRLPESYLIDKEGVVVQRYRGPHDWDDPKIISEISRYLRNP